MSDTYCGKECSSCQQKEILDCPGCKAGPGNIYRGDCPLSSCIREKGHESCDTCNRNGRCPTRARRDTMAQERIEKNEQKQQHLEALQQRSPILAKWLNGLFILNIISLIVEVLDNISALTKICAYVNVAVSIGCVICLWMLRKQEKRYQTVAILNVVSIALSVAVIACASSTGTALLLDVCLIICNLSAIYNECQAHSAVVDDYDSELSQKWADLWKWYIGVYVFTMVGLFLMMISTVLGAIMAVIGLIGMIVADIAKLVSLFSTTVAVRIN